jgi:hypothetical protein
VTLVSTFSAVAALPYEHLDRATAGLRAELRRQILAADVHAMPQRETFDATDRLSSPTCAGRTLYEDRATVENLWPFDVATAASGPSHVPTESG